MLLLSFVIASSFGRLNHNATEGDYDRPAGFPWPASEADRASSLR